jgi:DnaJ-class molecular chaperone
MNDDLASAWKAWCASARSYQDEHQPETSETEEIHRTEAQFEQPTEDGTAVDTENGGLVGWLKRGLKKLKSEPLHRVSSQDKHLRLRVNETTLLYGGKHRIAIHRDALCPSCIGDTIYGCVCGGTGRIKVRDVVSVTVPPGARSGVQLRLEGKGTAGMAGQPNGDLFLQLEPSDVRGFRRENIDLHGVFSVPASVATGGGVVEVMLPRGEVKVHVPPGTRSGDKFRLRGLGVPAWRGQEIGDVYLSVMLN